MKNKIFSFIHNKEIGLTPGIKFIPSSEFTEILNTQEVLDLVKKDAIEYRKEVALECEKLKEQASKEGYEAGFIEWAEHISKFQEEINSLRKEFTKVLAPIALAATQKIVGKAFEISNDLIYNIVENALKPVTQHRKVTIYVNKNDLTSLERNREKLKNLFENIESLSIRERDDITQGGCVIETEIGIINARLENQWVLLEKAFDKMMRSISTNNEQKGE